MTSPRGNPSPPAGEGGSPRSGESGEGAFHAKISRFARPEDTPHPARPLDGPPSPARGEGRRVATWSIQKNRSRKLRAMMTDAERKLWFALKDRRVAGVKFRRQVPVEHFIADFCCFELRLIVEVDGGQHNDSQRDAERDAWFAANGYRTLRFWNNDVLGNLEGVLTRLIAEIDRRQKEIAR